MFRTTTTLATAHEAVKPTPPAELVSVPFRDGVILAALVDGAPVVPLRSVCEALGLDWSSQLKKLKAKPWACVVFITTQMPSDDQARQAACVPLRALPMWLATIHPSKVATAARPMLDAFQAEACDVLYRHFLAPSAPKVPAGWLRRIEARLERIETRQILAESRALARGCA